MSKGDIYCPIHSQDNHFTDSAHAPCFPGNGLRHHLLAQLYPGSSFETAEAHSTWSPRCCSLLTTGHPEEEEEGGGGVKTPFIERM